MAASGSRLAETLASKRRRPAGRPFIYRRQQQCGGWERVRGTNASPFLRPMSGASISPDRYGTVGRKEGGRPGPATLCFCLTPLSGDWPISAWWPGHARQNIAWDRVLRAYVCVRGDTQQAEVFTNASGVRGDSDGSHLSCGGLWLAKNSRGMLAVLTNGRYPFSWLLVL